jgi:hypothetical protein
MRSRVWVVIDCSMLVVVVALQAWRLTGVPTHEWLAVAFLAAVLAHLLLHWPWVASRSKRLFQPGNARTRVNYGLNLTLFVSIIAAFASGFVISKVIMPLHLTPGQYLKWHGIHEFSSRVALFAAALHLALNWDVLLKRRPRFRNVLRPAAIIVIAIAIVSGAVFAFSEIMRRPDIILITPDGRRIENAAPPPDIAALRRDEIAPSSRGIPPFVIQSAALAVAAVIGKKVLRLRLD